MPPVANTGSATPPPRIGKIGPYTVFVTPDPSPETNSLVAPPPNPPPPVMAPPAQFYKEKPSPFAFFWDALSKLQNAHESLDEHVAHWFGLNQSKYQWALDNYYENNINDNNGMIQTDAKTHVKPAKVQSV